MDDEQISTFVAITSQTPEVARGFIEVAGGDVERAIELFFENPELASGFSAGSASTAPPVPPASTRPRNTAGRQDESGVIHIDSDDDDADMDAGDFDEDEDQANHRAAVRHAAEMAQEEEDAAMAKRLQEELYGSGGGGSGVGPDDDVRAPIARTTETLVAPNPAWGPADHGGVDDFLQHMRRNRQPRGGGGPFSQQIWADPEDAPTPSTGEEGAHAQRLQDLFRPPYDLMQRMSWDEARAVGKEDKKWILVNLQDMSDFNCQTLNRDVWKDPRIKSLVSENFLFLQYDKDFADAQEYLTFYFPNQSHENPDNYPHVSIIDPRTGEQVKVWSGRPFPSASDFHAELAEFLDRYSLAANSKNPVAQTTAKKPQTVDVDRMTEDEMLEMALKNSLANASGSRSGSNPNIHDPDALTKGESSASAGNQEESTAAQSSFARISSTNAHTEPANNPSSTTRIQFRHPTGRVIRRFNLADPVERIYEWLKAEPLEGKEGVHFELKKMPAGQDLIESLEQTVEGAGLKQGTVMIEFIED